MEGGVNTAGNLILVNENGIVASPSIPRAGLDIMAEVMGVPVVVSTIAGQDVVGSLGCYKRPGSLTSPRCYRRRSCTHPRVSRCATNGWHCLIWFSIRWCRGLCL